MIGGYNIEFFNSEDIFKWNTNEVSAVIFRYIYIIFLLVQLVTGRHLKKSGRIKVQVRDKLLIIFS